MTSIASVAVTGRVSVCASVCSVCVCVCVNLWACVCVCVCVQRTRVSVWCVGVCMCTLKCTSIQIIFYSVGSNVSGRRLST